MPSFFPARLAVLRVPIGVYYAYYFCLILLVQNSAKQRKQKTLSAFPLLSFKGVSYSDMPRLVRLFIHSE